MGYGQTERLLCLMVVGLRTTAVYLIVNIKSSIYLPFQHRSSENSNSHRQSIRVLSILHSGWCGKYYQPNNVDDITVTTLVSTTEQTLLMIIMRI